MKPKERSKKEKEAILVLSPVVKQKVWYPDHSWIYSYAFDPSILRAVPCQLVVVPLLNSCFEQTALE